MTPATPDPLFPKCRSITKLPPDADWLIELAQGLPESSMCVIAAGQTSVANLVKIVLWSVDGQTDKDSAPEASILLKKNTKTVHT